MSDRREINELMIGLIYAEAERIMKGLPPMTVNEWAAEVLLIRPQPPNLAAQFGEDPEGVLWGPAA